MDVTIDIPDWFAAKLGVSEAGLSRRASEALLAEAYRSGRVKDDELDDFSRRIEECQGRSSDGAEMAASIRRRFAPVGGDAPGPLSGKKP